MVRRNNKTSRQRNVLRKSGILHPSITNTIGLSSLALLAALGYVALTPRLVDSASAVEYCKGGNGYVECDTTHPLTTYARIAPVVSVGMQSDVVMDIVPKSSGVTIEQPVTVSVSTNSSEGYSLYMKTLDTTNSMTNTNSSNNSVIAPVDGGENGVDINTLAEQGNVWGYSIGESGAGSGLYQAVPMDQDQPIRKTSGIAETSTTDTLELTFGLHVDTSLPSGTYTNQVLVSAVANPVTITNLSELVFMQDMTTSICSNTAFDVSGEMDPTKADIANPVTKQLIDTRDGKKYWVSKLADGNCWMVQNLALDLSTEKTLTPADTDVTSDYTPASNTRTDDSQPIGSQNNDADNDRTWSPAFYGTAGDSLPNNQYSWGIWQNTVLATPLFGRRCSSSHSSDQYDSVVSNEQLYEVCSGEGFMNAENWNPTYTAQESNIKLVPGNEVDQANNAGGLASAKGITVEIIDGEKQHTYTGLVAADPFNGTYDAHYLVGNYYQYNAATAGSGQDITFGNASSSICSKGWTLPKAGNQANLPGSLNSNNGTFYNLLNAYGVASTALSKSYGADNSDNVLPVAGISTLRDSTVIEYKGLQTNEYDIAKSPLYFVRSGDVYISTGFLKYAGQSGFAYSRSSTAFNNAYYFDFNPSGVDPSHGPYGRSLSFSVRCLAK